ncbi:hypothetical protein [Streptomyces sp. NBC_00539]|uniref:hypothetical protein n=1 Tax=Streptomyces sp. NBC_00539 TaxID=2975770 RepID=UPI002E80822E|nr:hypothetical protein [Streptomyces sp. NBC_00539]WUC65846.1 hypothetical protein OG861_17265 [Streptomyces sp. NBC_00539]
MTVRAGWLLPAGQTREDTRLVPLGVMAPETAMGSRDGVIAGGTALAATGTAAMQVQLAVGRALVQGADAQGAYPVAVTAPETLTIADGHAQYGRIDAVVLRVYDTAYDTTGQTIARAEIVQGAATATPVPPTLPAATLRLWEITVPAGTSAGTGGITWASALADRRRYTSAYGGIIPRGWGLSFPGAYAGQYRDNGNGLDRWDGGSWQPLDATVGWTPLSLASGFTNNGNGNGDVKYRRITLGGAPFLQLRGGVSWATAGSPPNGGNLLASVLPASCRPAALTSVPIAAASVPIKLDASGNGQLRLIASAAVGTWAALSGVQYPLDA